MNLSGTHILVLGLGESGLAMARWCGRQGAVLRVADSRAAPPGLDALARDIPGAKLRCGPFDDSLLDGIALLALSPGLAPHEPLVQEATRRGIKVVGEIELFARALRALGWRERSKVIAITGTNGKTTTTALTGALCRACGLRTEVAGNISPAALDALMHVLDQGVVPDVWVLELSSFQLETTDTLDADTATVLNVTQDHLDRHPGGLAAYAAAKARIFGAHTVQVLNRDDSQVGAMQRPGVQSIRFGDGAPSGNDYGLAEVGGRLQLVRGTQTLLALDDMQLAGRHNALNALAALALCEAIGLPQDRCIAALKDFSGLPHRVETVLDIDGIRFIDDSKGTNVGATVAAIEGLGRPLNIILGGDGKGQDFAPLGPVCARHARFCALIGRDAPAIASVLAAHAVAHRAFATLEEATRAAFDAAQPGDAVLLSPACASLDMFRHYAHRAEVFVAEARRLATLPGAHS
ncbi:UDP-N-acetylmuramoyl-L-alanine--D-glutamate ligase [Methyloversatilis sp.]|uniref:UDP-N-acetylmuramoyl-L-alanine--D-glutamate ligase n=1 Tax=Methyloversatilis sp. TaxID=2569862 RepID=UPI0027367C76|nr:UDP-N-acetylmuramoyl-L-alanine--D-glutamate ligase [Methyloversatilis sp.]MDP2869398.1 UDP-N-acetylmuramoyl-L-alanine--D-glutamate ligase [Methyloversatilis sp.]MDP3457337.1 UDP-N-acetylmuramoyl-L-alanine--D-glutamate ligase [Methyloversatilis sp.]MDP3580046.1 UDP-N-acetylmuramoyl-L-alanine--D-glutamate ligase [Methyloversatilis sp.]